MIVRCTYISGIQIKKRRCVTIANENSCSLANVKFSWFGLSFRLLKKIPNTCICVAWNDCNV